MTDGPALIFRHKHDNGAIRIEFFDDDGGCEIAQFSGVDPLNERSLSVYWN
jgi:hypothetical protein